MVEKKPNIANVCETCDYSPTFCDGDVHTCERAILDGANSEKGWENGSFDKRITERELNLRL